MWGLDNAVAGTIAVDDRQWIEIRNRLSVDLPLAGLYIQIKSGRPGNSAIPKADVATKLNAMDNLSSRSARYNRAGLDE